MRRLLAKTVAVGAVWLFAALGVDADAHTSHPWTSCLPAYSESVTSTSIYVDSRSFSGHTVRGGSERYETRVTRPDGSAFSDFDADSEVDLAGLQAVTTYGLAIRAHTSNHGPSGWCSAGSRTTTGVQPTPTPTPTPSPTPEPTPTPPPGTVPMPPASLWSMDSNWRMDVSQLPVRADNAALVGDLANRGSGYILNRSYGVGVAFADASTPTYTVINTRYQFDGVRAVSGVPIPASFRVADGNDGHGTVILNDPLSPKHGCVYDWFEGVPNASGTETSASYFDMTHTTHNGWLGLTRGSSANNLSGVLWPQHFDGSVPINHALALWVDSARNVGGALRPSKTSDGGGGSTKLPEGASVRLHAGFNLTGYPAWLQRIGVALKSYGARVIDQHGDAPALTAVGYLNGQPTSLPFSSQYGTGQLPVAFLQNLEVVAWDSADIQGQSYTVDPGAGMCGTLIR